MRPRVKASVERALPWGRATRVLENDWTGGRDVARKRMGRLGGEEVVMSDRCRVRGSQRRRLTRRMLRPLG